MILRTSQAVFAAVVVVTTVGVTHAHDGDAWMHAEVARLLAVERATPSATASEGPATAAATASAGYGVTMAASFGAFKPRVRSYFDATTFYVESDNVPDNSRMPTPMVGITSWQQQIPLPASYFASTTNPERDQGSIGFGKPNVWRLPLVPTPSASPIPISAGNFQRGAIALGADGIAIFNPRNNTGRVAYEIGELDLYGGHCGLGDDYHYHIAPVHLQAVTGIDKPIAWALDGYPIYGYTEPDGTTRQALDAEGGHNHGAWSYHYHAIGSAATGPAAPYLPTAFHGTVVNFGGQVDGQPTIGSLRQSGTGGYTAQPVAGARIIAFKNPVALDTDAAGNLVESLTGVPSPDQFLMRVQIGGATYDECWRINRAANPKTVTVTWRLPSIAPTTATYDNGNNRLTAYAMGSPSLAKLPDTGQTLDATSTFGEDSDYTINAPAYTDHGDGTITDRVTGLMWQKVDAGESTWDNAVVRAATITTGGYADWRLPTPTELFSLVNFDLGNPVALNTTFFPSNPAGAAAYWWASDIYGADATRVWCVNSGGGLGPKPKSETISAGGTLRYQTRYVRGAKPGNGHDYVNNLDGTITDTGTGLRWAQVPSPAVTWQGALAYAEDLALAGFTDWRLPNIKELQSLTDYTLATATTAAAALAPVNRVLFPTATTPAAAYWSSTVLRGGGNAVPTSAWLVEFGVNNAIPAANGPGRNAQGVISYEVMTSSYRVFAVRGPVAAYAIATFNPQPVAAGGEVTLTGTFPTGSVPVITLDNGGTTPVATLTAGSNSTSQIKATVPAGTASGTYGLKVTFGTGNTAVVLMVQNFVVGTGTGTGPLTITGAPLSVTIPSGERTQLRVTATGSGVLSYQWYLGQSGSTAIPISGANRSTFTTPSLTANTAYWVLVTDENGLVVNSQTASVTVSAASPITVTQQLLNPGYNPGGAVVVTNTITYTGTAPSRIDWATLLPAGWNYLGSGGSEGGARPAYKNGDLLEWTWTTVPPSPIEFTYTVSVPAGTNGDQVIASLVTSQASGTSYQTMAKPDPLVLRSASMHTADSNRDGKINLTELTRVIELYNYRTGTNRTGAYHVQTGTEDGFELGP